MTSIMKHRCMNLIKESLLIQHCAMLNVALLQETLMLSIK